MIDRLSEEDRELLPELRPTTLLKEDPGLLDDETLSLDGALLDEAIENLANVGADVVVALPSRVAKLKVELDPVTVEIARI